MKTATPVSQKEVVRLLSIEHGHKRASELTGVPYDLVRQWSVRGNWRSSQNVTDHPVTRTVDALQATLASRKQESRAKLSEYQVRAATEAAAHGKPLSITRQVNDLASIHAKVWPEDQGKDAQFTLNVLNINSLSVDNETALDM